MYTKRHVSRFLYYVHKNHPISTQFQSLCTKSTPPTSIPTIKSSSNSSISGLTKRSSRNSTSSKILRQNFNQNSGFLKNPSNIKDKIPGSSSGIPTETASQSHIYTTQTEHQTKFSSFNGGFEHIEADKEAEDQAWNTVLQNPRLIVKHLDNYVIGQDRAKRVLSVAVFNHYNRVRANLQASKAQTTTVPEIDTRTSSEMELSSPRVPLPVTASSSFQYHNLKRSWINPSTSGNSSGNSTVSQFTEVPSASELSPTDAPKEPATDTLYDKSNVLLLGPTGSGKTLLARTLANVLKVPFSMSDATPFTQAGYVGEDVELVIQRLLQNCDYDVKKAEQGIVFIDEIDKIARRPDAMAISKDVSGEGVQQALLRMLEGTNVTVTDKAGNRKPGNSLNGSSMPSSSKGDVYTVNTTNILFILSGAFIGLDKIVADRISRASIGFDAPLRVNSPPAPSSKPLLDMLEPSDLTKYGLIPEFIGRLPVMASVATLDEAALIRVLTEPRNSLIKQYQGLFRLNKIELHFTYTSLRAIAQVAILQQTGARGLRRIMENLLLDPMFEVPGTAVHSVLVTRACVDNNEKPLYLAKNQSNDIKQLISDEDGDQNDLAADNVSREQVANC